jgi:succinate dehydrogenase/fumarate reductase cytochrome b subunit
MSTKIRELIVLYGFTISYITAPVFGLGFDSISIIELVQGLPEWLKYAGKTVLAAPFAFHSLNGLRHLSWDTGKCEFAITPFLFLKSYCVLFKSLLLRVHGALGIPSLRPLRLRQSHWFSITEHTFLKTQRCSICISAVVIITWLAKVPFVE